MCNPALSVIYLLMLLSICDPPRENRDKGDSTLTTRFHFKTKEFDFSQLRRAQNLASLLNLLFHRTR